MAKKKKKQQQQQQEDAVVAAPSIRTAAPAGGKPPPPLTIHTLHLVLLIGILQPTFLFFALFFVPQRAASITRASPSSSSQDTTSTFTNDGANILVRGLHAITALYDSPDQISDQTLRSAVLRSAAIAIFITQAWITRALGNWIATEKLRHSTNTKAEKKGTFEELALTLLTLPFTTLLWVAILVGLLGAPIPFTSTAGSNHTLPTLGLGFHLACLITLTPAHVLGTDWTQWDAVFLPAPESEDGRKRRAQEAWHAVLFYPAAGALVGALLASFGLALDWNRPWQVWPIPPLIGSTVGLMLGNWVGIRAWTNAAWSAKFTA
ncbi:hypothetical protein V8E36_001603 [Tilletia maclaganii]